MESSNVILDFCGECGMLLPSGSGTSPDPICENCGASVESRESRIQGVFSWEEGNRLMFCQFSIELQA